MATVTVTSISETDTSIVLNCTFVNTSPSITWDDQVSFIRERVRGLTLAQLRDDLFLPKCKEIVEGRIGLRRIQQAGTNILNTPQNIPGTN